MKKILPLSVIVFLLAVLMTVVFQPSFEKLFSQVQKFTASVFFVDSSTKESLQTTFVQAKNGGRKMKVLIVPGHDNETVGAQFGNTTEAKLNLELGEELYKLLNKNSALDVTLARMENGYNPILANYFNTNRNIISDFIASQKNLMTEFLRTGKLRAVSEIEHNRAPNDTAIKLYGINKWANENKEDIVIHIHFNDYPRKKLGSRGEYSGFSIYIPESQFSNAKGSKALAEAVRKRLRIFYPQSDLPREDVGVVESQDLIAIGAYNTLDGAGLLMEYGYVYEPSFTNRNLRAVVISDLALQTYLGLMDFFGEKVADGGINQTHFLPFTWENDLEKKERIGRDILSLQAALVLEGVYPPAGETKNDCPLSGKFASCTEKSVKAFQEKYGISPATGMVGERTRAKLNELYQGV